MLIELTTEEAVFIITAMSFMDSLATITGKNIVTEASIFEKLITATKKELTNESPDG